MIRRPPRSTRTDTLFPYTTLFRSHPPSCNRFSPSHRCSVAFNLRLRVLPFDDTADFPGVHDLLGNGLHSCFRNAVRIALAVAYVSPIRPSCAPFARAVFGGVHQGPGWRRLRSLQHFRVGGSAETAGPVPQPGG